MKVRFERLVLATSTILAGMGGVLWLLGTAQQSVSTRDAGLAVLAIALLTLSLPLFTFGCWLAASSVHRAWRRRK